MATLLKTKCVRCKQEIYVTFADVPKFAPANGQECRRCGYTFTGEEESIFCRECKSEYLVVKDMERPFKCPCGYGYEHYTPSEITKGKDKSPLRGLKEGLYSGKTIIYQYDWNNDPTTQYIFAVDKEYDKITQVTKGRDNKSDSRKPCCMTHTTDSEYVISVVGPYDLFEAAQLVKKYLAELSLRESKSGEF